MQELTRQQNVIVRLLAEGYDNYGIANELNITYATVKNHVSNIIKRLNARDRLEVVVFYYQEEIKRLKGVE